MSQEEKEKELKSNIRWYHLYFALLWPLVLIFYPHTYRGRENIPDGPAILCAPHTHLVDPLLVSLAMGWKHFVHHMAKAELLGSAFAAWCMKKAGSIFVRRGESDIEAFKQCIRVLKEGRKLMIFPEGTRVKGAELGEFKSGAVRLAQKLQVPIVPVYLTRNKRLFHHMDVVFGEPYLVPRDRGADLEALSQELKDKITALGESVHG